MKKSKFFVFLIVVIFVVMASSIWAQGAKEEEERKYEGVELVWADIKWAFSDAAKEIVSEFEEQTGAKIIIEEYDPTGMSDKLKMEAMSKSSDIDIYYLSPGWLGAMVEMDFIYPVDEYLKKNNIKFEDDYSKAAIDMVRYPGIDKYLGFPHSASAMISAYRKDLFEDPKEKENFKDEYGYELKPPDTMQELLDVAKFFTRDTNGDGNIDFYGYARPHGSRDAAQQTVQALFWTMGTAVFCSDQVNPSDHCKENPFEITINSPENVDALYYFLDLHQYEPEETFAWLTWEQVEFFKAGKAAMIPTWYTYVPTLLNSDENQFAEQTWFHPQPNYNQSGGGGIAINPNSKNIEAALDFVAWITSKETSIVWMQHGGPVNRNSTYEAPELKEAFPDTYEALMVSQEALENKSTSRITIPESGTISDVLYDLLHDLRDGKITPEEGLERAEDEIEDIFERAGYL